MLILSIYPLIDRKWLLYTPYSQDIDRTIHCWAVEEGKPQLIRVSNLGYNWAQGCHFSFKRQINRSCFYCWECELVPIELNIKMIYLGTNFPNLTTQFIKQITIINTLSLLVFSCNLEKYLKITAIRSSLFKLHY